MRRRGPCTAAARLKRACVEGGGGAGPGLKARTRLPHAGFAATFEGFSEFPKGNTFSLITLDFTFRDVSIHANH